MLDAPFHPETHSRRRASAWAPAAWGIVAWLVAFSALGGSAARAMTYVPLTDDELVERAAVIVEGQIVGFEPGAPGTTRVAVEVTRSLHGSSAESLVVELPMGSDGDGRMKWVSGTPLWQLGDSVLLFLGEEDDGGAHRLIEHGLGAFRLVASPDGRRLALRDLSDAAPLEREPVGLGRPKAGTDEPIRDADLFLDWIDRSIAARAGGGAAVASYLLGPGNDAVRLRHKYRRARSTTAPPPLGCGPSGGHTLRIAAFRHGGVFGWRSYFLGSPDLDQGGITALRRALAAWRDDPGSVVDIRHHGLATAGAGLAESDGENLIAFEDPFDQIAGGWEQGGVVALTATWFDCVRLGHRGRVYHPIVEADIVFQDGLAPLFASAPHAERLAEQLIGRQLGLALGFELSNDPDALLARTHHDDARGALLGVDDLHGLSVVYGDDRPAPTIGRAVGLRGAVEARSGTVRLDWVDDVAGESLFRVERRQLEAEDGSRTDGAWRPVGYAPADTERYVDPLIYSGRVYEYRLVPVNGRADGEASASLEVAIPVGAGLPAAPSVLRGSAVSPTRAHLTWRDNACDEDDQRLHVRLLGGAWEEVPFMLPRDHERVVVDGLEPGAVYEFRILAENANGPSPTSNVARVATPTLDAPCQPDDETLCLLDGRFEVRALVDDPALGPRPAHAVGIDGGTGSFWFFQADNPELVVEVVDGRSENGSFWVRRGLLTTLAHEIVVTDTETGATQLYTRGDSDSMACGGSDVVTFSDRPQALPPETSWSEEKTTPSGVPTDVPQCFLSATDLSLHADRFRIRLETLDADGQRVSATALDAGDRAGHFTFGSPNGGLIDWSVKLLDGRPVNGSFWLFHGPVGAGIETWLTVEDQQDGTTKKYHRRAEDSCSQIDLEAFPGA